MEDNEKRQLQDKIDDYKKAIRTLEESKDEINYQDKIIENIPLLMIKNHEIGNIFIFDLIPD